MHTNNSHSPPLGFMMLRVLNLIVHSSFPPYITRLQPQPQPTTCVTNKHNGSPSPIRSSRAMRSRFVYTFLSTQDACKDLSKGLCILRFTR